MGETRSIVFFIGNMTHSGGTERVVSVIAGGLAERGYPVSVVSLWGTGQPFFPVDKAVTIFWMETLAPKAGILRQLKLLEEILKQRRARVLVDVDTILGCYSFFMKCRMPGLCWISWEHFHYYFPFEKNRLLRRAVRRLAGRYADRLVVLTREDQGYYRRNLHPRCGITCIHDPAPYDTRFQKETEEPMIFAAGRLTGVKGFDLLIDSWKQLEHRYPCWQVVVAGDGEEKGRLEARAKAAGLKRIRFTGRVADMEEYYRKAAFFVLPSRSEGFGMALLEAMWFGLPAVSYACKTGPKELVTDGENGFLVQPGNVSQFAGKMEVLMRDEALRRKMGKQAAESAGRFEKERILDQWEALAGGNKRKSVRNHSHV